jgi:DNA-binding transcriptional LysR family regulator
MRFAMNDWDLRIFEMVARTGGIGRAALELNTAQSNVTTRMRHLEEELDEPLFERHSRGVTLTAAGQRLRPYAVQVLNLLEQGRRAAKDDGHPSGKLSLGSLETTAALRLPAALAAYARAYPDVDLCLSTGTTASLIEDVLQLRLDGAFVTGPVNHPELVSKSIFREELVLVTGRNISSLNQLTHIRDLKVLVFRAGCSYRRQLELLLAQRGVVGLRMLEFGSLDAILACVGAGVGVTLLPRALVSPVARERGIELHTLYGANANVETVFVRREGCHSSSAMTELLRVVTHDRIAVTMDDDSR